MWVETYGLDAPLRCNLIYDIWCVRIQSSRAPSLYRRLPYPLTRCVTIMPCRTPVCLHARRRTVTARSSSGPMSIYQIYWFFSSPSCFWDTLTHCTSIGVASPISRTVGCLLAIVKYSVLFSLSAFTLLFLYELSYDNSSSAANGVKEMDLPSKYVHIAYTAYACNTSVGIDVNCGHKRAFVMHMCGGLHVLRREGVGV